MLQSLRMPRLRSSPTCQTQGETAIATRSDASGADLPCVWHASGEGTRSSGALAAATIGYATWALNAPLALPAAVTRTPLPTAGPAVELPDPAGAASAVTVTGGAEFLGEAGLTQASGSTDPLPMASISKVITALVILEAHPIGAGEVGPTITFGTADHDLYNQYYVQGATIAEMPTGSSMSLHDALELMLVTSASNYADAVSTWAYGSRAAFLGAARDWLDRNGLTQTVLVEPTGISPRNVSTAGELIALGDLAMANPVVAEIVAMPALSVPGFSGANTNSLLGSEGVRGIKTGTPEGSNLLYSSLLDVGIGEPLHVTGVVIGGAGRDQVNRSVEALLTSLRSGFHPVPVGSAGEEVGTVTSTAGSRTATAELVLDGDIAPPDAWWRLTHPFELGG
ncbi:D-alanyl-D-alanine carboxypeptidase family protein [Microbacterium sp.]|uniref:D-alanyl-D-alanine carboxypeptidase family protein n=1 Tax=Microbacterium sp. TaxID=51671 RepID=UPI0039E5AD10